MHALLLALPFQSLSRGRRMPWVFGLHGRKCVRFAPVSPCTYPNNTPMCDSHMYAPRCVRFALVANEERLVEAAARIGRWFKAHGVACHA